MEHLAASAKQLRTQMSQLQTHWRADMQAGFLIFLIALPLCLGVAVTSGFPPMAGVTSAIVGGLLVSRINGSYLTITGPAAGLIVVILASVQNLGEGDVLAGYRLTLAAIVFSGALQILLGYFKAGRLAAFFPASVVHGMLAAIGIIIISKQLPTMLGIRLPDSPTILAGIGTLWHAHVFFVPTIALIALLAICLLIGWPRLRNPLFSKMPAPLLVIVLGIGFGYLFDLAHFVPEPLFKQPKEINTYGPYLVSMPKSLISSIAFPDFSKIATLRFWESVLSITLVGSLETLLSSAAVDKLDPEKRYSNLNRDLGAIGVGNLVSGMIGGLPMIAEIVRSSANIDYGAKTGWSNFFHGGFLLVFVLLFPHIIGTIPLASLAALLVYIGYRLASPQAFAKTLDLGKEQLFIFVVTILGVLASNLLAGVLVGILAKLLIHLMRGVPLKHLLSLSYHVEKQGNRCLIKISGSAVFSNFIALKSHLAALPDGLAITFDLSDVYLIDHTVMDFIEDYRQDYAKRGGDCEIHGLHDHHSYADHKLAARIKKRLSRRKLD
ncbi:MAG: SulP family inorganic anion transporter [Gammaproteobacteria bacterium]